VNGDPGPTGPTGQSGVNGDPGPTGPTGSPYSVYFANPGTTLGTMDATTPSISGLFEDYSIPSTGTYNMTLVLQIVPDMSFSAGDIIYGIVAGSDEAETSAIAGIVTVGSSRAPPFIPMSGLVRVTQTASTNFNYKFLLDPSGTSGEYTINLATILIQQTQELNS